MILIFENPIKKGYLLARYDIRLNLFVTCLQGLEIYAGSEKDLKDNILHAKYFGYIK